MSKRKAFWHNKKFDQKYASAAASFGKAVLEREDAELELQEAIKTEAILRAKVLEAKWDIQAVEFARKAEL